MIFLRAASPGAPNKRQGINQKEVQHHEGQAFRETHLRKVQGHPPQRPRDGGDNAQGKTNILEALYLAGTTKSHRGSKDREIIQFDREAFL